MVIVNVVPRVSWRVTPPRSVPPPLPFGLEEVFIKGLHINAYTETTFNFYSCNMLS